MRLNLPRDQKIALASAICEAASSDCFTEYVIVNGDGEFQATETLQDGDFVVLDPRCQFVLEAHKEGS